ncbi:MAG: hypothetical protein RBS89_08585, partial [Candidatus Delongbacteria bacterium]|nr:hypothetical protein [Candidatus Delongbacteria bacterium]
MKKHIYILLVVYTVGLFSFSHFNRNEAGLAAGSFKVKYPCVKGDFTVYFNEKNYYKYNGDKYSLLIIEALNDVSFKSFLAGIPNVPNIICQESEPETIAGKIMSILFLWDNENGSAIMSTEALNSGADPDGITITDVNQIKITVYNEKAKDYLITDELKERLKATIRHEVLHGLGLGHTWSNEPVDAYKKIMYYTNLNGIRNPYPGPDEKNGLLAWYAPIKFEEDGTEVMNLLNGQNIVDLFVIGSEKEYNVELFFNYEIDPKTRIFPKGSYLGSPQCIGGDRHKIQKNTGQIIEWKSGLEDDYEELLKKPDSKPYIRMFAENCEDNYHNQPYFNSNYIFHQDRPMDELTFNISKPELDVSNTYFPIFGNLEFFEFVLTAVDFKNNTYYFNKDEGFQDYIKFVRYDIIASKSGTKYRDVKSFGDVYYSEDTKFNASIPSFFFNRDLQYEITATFFANDGVTAITSVTEYIQPNKMSTDYVDKEKTKGTETDNIPELVIDYTNLNNGNLKLKTNSIPISLDSDPDGAKEMPTSIKYLYAKVEEGLVGEYEEIGVSSSFEYDWDMKDLNTGHYIVKVMAKYPSENSYNQKYISFLPIYFYRPISLSSAIMVFKKPKPDTGAKTVWGTIIPLLELDTLRVTVP